MLCSRDPRGLDAFHEFEVPNVAVVRCDAGVRWRPRLSIAAFAALVAASIAAFFVTQHLKVTTPLIQGSPRPVPGVIDPLHGVPCVQSRNSGSTTISFYLQHRSDDVDVFVVERRDGEIVRTVATDRHMRKGVRNPDGVFHWDGRLWTGPGRAGRDLPLPGRADPPEPDDRPDRRPGQGQDASRRIPWSRASRLR